MKTNFNKALLLGAILIYVMALSLYVQGVPQGATISSNTTDTGPTNTADNRSDDGGTITTMELDSTQQNPGWKAYVGNVTGTLTLDDASSNTIYNWDIGNSISGEVYVSRDNNVDWGTGSVQCAPIATITTEQNYIGGAGTDADSINRTYNDSQHPVMQVGVNTIPASNCRAAYTFQSDAAQAASATANFTAILLEDSDNSLIYATFIEQDETGFDGATYDFQVIVPDNETAEIVQYFFYLEIGS